MSSEPQIVFMPGGVRTEIHLTGEDTGGFFCLLVDEPPADWRLPAHLHAEAAETIHIVEGEFEMTIDGAAERLGPGETVHIPPGVVHSGANVGEETGRRLVTFSPAGMEHFFWEAGALYREDKIDTGKALDAARRHGWEFVDPTP